MKKVLSFIPSNNKENPPRLETSDDPEKEDVELDRLLPAEHFKAFEMHQVIHQIVDNGDFMEIHKEFAKNSFI